MPVLAAGAHVLRPLTAEAFRPFGQVLVADATYTVNLGHADRTDLLANLAHRETTPQLCLSHFDVRPMALPATITELEAHPYTAQVFLPITESRPVVVVALAGADGRPDPETLAAFLGAPGQAILYDAGVWHAGLTTASDPGHFLMAMWRGSRPDTLVEPLFRPLVVDLAG
ncbi:ureidoglycolate lyase [Xanthobacter sp.]|uniref:ureidoglycolate lyase n=1 Tax=Xanthobacter sp. TaxID=35809 RepID=UPI0025DF0F93|nr:ureidoglycolate lyase [Xanthobacter sp.]